MTSLANKHRPRRFDEVVGQEAEVKVLTTILEKNWKPNAIMLTGPFGTGKTTLSRLIARAVLCDNREGVEPCGECNSCLAVDEDNHPGYTELDAASQGLVSDVRAMKDMIAYRVAGDKARLICYDESHMLSQAAQNALLQTIEEGQRNTIFIFATTEAGKMLPTIRSRCVELQMKLLGAGQIRDRILKVAELEGIKIEPRAAAVIGTYVRGQVRDAIVLLEQLGQTTGDVTEEAARTYLRLDKNDLIYQFLTMTDKREGVEKLEELLCNFSPSDLAELIGDILVTSYKLSIGIDNNTQADRGWLMKVVEIRGGTLLDQAEAILSLRTDFSTITYGIAAFANILFENKTAAKGPKNSLSIGAQKDDSVHTMPTRKPGKG